MGLFHYGNISRLEHGIARVALLPRYKSLFPVRKTCPTMASADTLTPPERLMLALCSREQQARKAVTAESLANTGLLGQVCELAAKHGTLGLVLVELERRKALDALAPEVAASLRHTLKHSRRQAMMWQFECAMVLQRMTAAGLHPVLLKGAALQVTSYREAAERSYGDIDLLLPENEVNAAIEALGPVGYSPPPDDVSALYKQLHFHYVLEKPSGFKVEVHWALERPGSPYTLNPQSFLDAARPVQSKALGTFHTPRPEYAALHLCIQNVENGFARLARMVDVDRLLAAPGFDWQLFAQIAAEANARVVVEFTLDIIHELLGTPLAPNVSKTIAASRAARWHLSLLRPVQLVLDQTAYKRPSVEALVNMWCRDTMQARRAWMGEMLSGSDAVLTLAIQGVTSVRSGLFWNGIAVTKMLAYQLWLYGTSSPLLLQKRGA